MSSEKSRTAACACGQLSISTSGEPMLVSSCSCTACQRRSGSPFGVTSFFGADQFSHVSGTANTYTRTSDAGRKITMSFCPECGTSVYWTLDAVPDRVAVAVGCFADPEFPSPVRHVWAAQKHHWVEFPDHFAMFDEAP